jgi:hypothetical protein
MKKKPCQGQQGHMYHNLYQSKKRECGEGGGLLIVPDQMHGFLEALKQRGMYGGRGGGGGLEHKPAYGLPAACNGKPTIQHVENFPIRKMQGVPGAGYPLIYCVRGIKVFELF